MFILINNEDSQHSVEFTTMKLTNNFCSFFYKNYRVKKMSVKFETFQSCNGFPGASSRNAKMVTSMNFMYFRKEGLSCGF